MVVPRYAARVEHLDASRSVEVRCESCGHKALIGVAVIKKKLPPSTFADHIRFNMRCTRCGIRGKVALDPMPAISENDGYR
jgi:uncharacterized Zn finger protein